MSNNTKIVVNCTTGEKTEVPLTAEEIAEREATLAELEQKQLEREQLLAEREAAKQAAKDKLAALGLTPEEISAITGA